MLGRDETPTTTAYMRFKKKKKKSHQSKKHLLLLDAESLRDTSSSGNSDREKIYIAVSFSSYTTE